MPVKVSYKGNKEKNLEDIRDFSLVIPTIEYHNVTWTWLDLCQAMKTDSRRVILSQVCYFIECWVSLVKFIMIRICIIV